jgi:hypothetical protein
MAHWKSLYGNDIHDVDYDALVSSIRARRTKGLLALLRARLERRLPRLPRDAFGGA